MKNEEENIIKELETYKKALDMACEYLGIYHCRDINEKAVYCSNEHCVEFLKVYFIEKAREENGKVSM